MDAGRGRRQGRAVIFTADLLGALRQRELSATAALLAGQTGLGAQDASPGDLVSGVYRRWLDLASGPFAMVDNGLDRARGLGL